MLSCTNTCYHVVCGLLGASSDVEMASRLARAMVTKYAMSDVVSIKWKCIVCLSSNGPIFIDYICVLVIRLY